MRGILSNITTNELDNLGDVPTLLNPELVEEVIENRL